MAFYVDEEQIWKCPKHPYNKRRRTGICPTCLRDRLITLCPECANTRPCSCDSTSASSSSSSSFSVFQHSGNFLPTGEVGRVSQLIESEPAFRRSRSLAIPFLRSRSKHVNDREFVDVEKNVLPRVSRSKINFWSVFKIGKTKKCELHDDGGGLGVTDDYSRMMRSRSLAVGVGGGDGFSPASLKRRGWYFPSPMKVFRQSKTSKLHMHEQSPMRRG